jgi:hypothetical protein
MKWFGQAWRAARCAMAAGVTLFALGACGGGVVGTGSGTGDGQGDIEYTAVGLCTAEFAGSSLVCKAVSTDPFGGTATVQWADTDKSRDAATVLAILEGNGMSLQVPCSQAAFLGTWGELKDGSLAFVGRYVDSKAIESRPASVRVLPAPEETGAVVGRVEMRDAAGSLLYGPWLVRRVDGAVSIAECLWP